MAFRVYDTEKKQWLEKNIYMNLNGELFKIKQSLFGIVKIPMALDSERYVFHRDIGLTDMYGNEVYEGDYIKAIIGKVREDGEDKVEIGVVIYAPELSSYIILCESSDTFYTLGSNISTEIAIIGNVFDGFGGKYE